MTEKKVTYKAESGRGFGIVLIAIGTLFLLGTLGEFDVWDVIGAWWPVILIFWGLARFAQSRFRRYGALIPFVFGLLFLLSNLNIISWDNVWKLIWPLAIISVGVGMLFKHARKKTYVVDEVKDIDNVVSHFVVFSSVDRVLYSSSFTGGTLTAIFGGIEIDFTNAALAKGRHELVVTTIFGGVELRVPEGWNIKLQATPIFGGVDNHARTATDADSLNELLINATAIFGGVEIKN